jgi:hypothetical protein
VIYISEKPAIQRQLEAPLSLVKFDCFKSYEESTAYLKGENVIRFDCLYHYATLKFKSDALPTLSMDGNYYSIPDPIEASCGDVWSTSTDILIDERELREKIEKILEKKDPLLTDNFLINLGFTHINMNMIYGKGIKITKT